MSNTNGRGLRSSTALGSGALCNVSRLVNVFTSETTGAPFTVTLRTSVADLIAATYFVSQIGQGVVKLSRVASYQRLSSTKVERC